MTCGSCDGKAGRHVTRWVRHACFLAGFGDGVGLWCICFFAGAQVINDGGVGGHGPSGRRSGCIPTKLGRAIGIVLVLGHPDGFLGQSEWCYERRRSGNCIRRPHGSRFSGVCRKTDEGTIKGSVVLNDYTAHERIPIQGHRAIQRRDR